MERQQLTRVLFWWISGIGLFVSGWVLFWLRMGSRDPNPFSSVGVPMTLVGLGLAMSLGALVYGLVFARSNPRKKPIKTADGVYIIAKLAEGREGPVYEIDAYSGKIDFIVQVALADGTRLEFATSREVYETAGEGLKGRITYQGRWLGRFDRRIGDGPDLTPYSG